MAEETTITHPQDTGLKDGWIKVEEGSQAPVEQSNNPAQPAAQTPTDTAGAQPGGEPTAAKPADTNTTPVSDLQKWLDESFKGKFKSADELVNYYNAAEPQLQEIPTLRDKVKTSPVLANDGYVQSLNKARLAGISKEAFDIAYSIGDVTTLDDKEACIKGLMARHQYSRADAEALVSYEYKLGKEHEPTQDGVELAPEVRIARLKVKQDASTHREYLNKLKAENLVEPPQPKSADDVQKEWGNNITQIVDKSKTFEIDIPEHGAFKHEFSASAIKEATEYVQEVVLGGLMPFNEETLADAQELFKEKAAYLSMKDMLTTAVKKSKNAADIENIVNTAHPTVETSSLQTPNVEPDPADAHLKRERERRGYTN